MAAPVLVADADPHFRRFVCIALGFAGIDAREAASEAEALRQVDAQAPSVVFIDGDLLDADDVVSAFGRLASTIRIVCLSALPPRRTLPGEWMPKTAGPSELIAAAGGALAAS